MSLCWLLICFGKHHANDALSRQVHQTRPPCSLPHSGLGSQSAALDDCNLNRMFQFRPRAYIQTLRQMTNAMDPGNWQMHAQGASLQHHVPTNIKLVAQLLASIRYKIGVCTCNCIGRGYTAVRWGRLRAAAFRHSAIFSRISSPFGWG